jgi:GNAT superfamily N-acetyltransferase
MPIREIVIDDVWDGALALMHRNWAETGFAFPFSPSREMYREMQRIGAMFGFGAFRDEVMVGYATAVVSRHPFNPDVVWCATDALYVAPEHRAGLLPARLIMAVEEHAEALGAQWVSWHTRGGTRLAETMLRHGYEVGDIVVIKEVGHGGSSSRGGRRGRRTGGQHEEAPEDPAAGTARATAAVGTVS